MLDSTLYPNLVTLVVVTRPPSRLSFIYAWYRLYFVRCLLYVVCVCVCVVCRYIEEEDRINNNQQLFKAHYRLAAKNMLKHSKYGFPACEVKLDETNENMW